MRTNTRKFRLVLTWLTLVALALSLGLALVGGAVPVARAGTLTVDNTIACDDVSGSPAYCTIQAAINAASDGDTINVAAGTYNERLTINKSLDLRGAQYGVDPTAAGARTNLANESTVDVSGLGYANPDIAIDMASGVSDVTVDGFTLIGDPTNPLADTSVIRCGGSAGTANNVSISNNIIDGKYGVIYKGGDTLMVHHNRLVVNKAGVVVQPNAASNVTISDNVFNLGTSPVGDEYAIYMTACNECSATGNTATGFVNGLGGSNLSQLTVSGNTFTGNKDAVSIWGSSTYITIRDNDLSSSLRYGISIKGQDVDITGNEITNNGDVGINIDRHVIDTERITIFNNNISGNTNYGVQVNTGAVTELINGSGNWWGANTSTGVAAEVSANVDYTPWLDTDTDISTDPGFQGDFSTLHVDDDSPQSGSIGRIQEGVDLVTASTIYVAAGTYNESIIFDAGFDKDNLTISGDASDRPEVTGGVRFLQTATLDGLTFENLYLKGVASGGNGIFDMDNSGAVNDFAMDNCVIDGGNVSGRSGFLGQNLGQSFSITDSEFKNILGWAVMDINSGSGDGGSDLPLSTVTFANNHVHKCNGSVALRGHATTKTTMVNAYGNTFEDLGNNQGEQGEQWAALEVNHAVSANVYNNTVTNVAQGQWGEGQAFQFWDIDTLNVYCNDITNNYQGIFIFGGSAGGTYGGPYAVPGGSISSNNITGNNQYGISVDPNATGGPLDATKNWWGSPTGPCRQLPNGKWVGKGDKVSANVAFVPWLTHPIEFWKR